MSGAPEITVFFASPLEYKSSKPGYEYLKDGKRGPGYYIPFFSADTFRGEEKGYYFGTGPKGLGYYLLPDPAITPKIITSKERKPAASRVKQEGITFIPTSASKEGDDADTSGDDEDNDDDCEDVANDFDTMTIKDCVCFNCEKTGVTKLMRLTTPFFGELMVSSFQCASCGFKDTKTEPIGPIMERGVRLALTVKNAEALNRRVITTKHSTISFSEIQLEIPPSANAGGRLTTIEGLVQEATVKLHEGNKLRKQKIAYINAHITKEKSEGKTPDSELVARKDQEQIIADKIDEIVRTLVAYARGEELPFKIIVEDLDGKAAIENPFAPKRDPDVVVTSFKRTKEQDERVGIEVQEDAAAIAENAASKTSSPDVSNSSDSEKRCKLNGEEITKMYYDAKNSDVRFASPCVACGRNGETRMAITKIPNFSEIILMCFVCEHCGFKDAEVKPGGEIADKGKKITLIVTKDTIEEDLKRDVLKSSDAGISIPDIGFESGSGTLGAVYTTVEGLLSQTLDNLKSSRQFAEGDSAPEDVAERMRTFISKFQAIVDGAKPFTLTITDPIGQSWVYSKFAPKPDPQITVEWYERSRDEDEMLGLNQIDTTECDIAEARAMANNDDGGTKSEK